MTKSLLRNAWLPVVLVAILIALDLVIDRAAGRRAGIDLPHLLLVGLALLSTFYLVRQATKAYQRTEAILRQARDELEEQVSERTAQLRRANEVLQAEIHERERAEAALRSAQLLLEAEKRHLEAVLQALPVGVIITDAQGGVVLTNGMDEQIWGPRPTTRSVDDYVQYRAWWADSGKPVEPHDWASAQAIEKGVPVFGQLLEIERFDGGRAYIVNSAVPIRDQAGQIVGSAVAIQDITELRRAEQALRESERRFRLVVENSRDGINLLDLRTGRYAFMSPAQVRLTGFSAEELRDLAHEEALERVHPDDREKSVAQLRELVQGQEQGSTAEYRWKVKSGEYRWFSDSRAVIRDEEGRPVALVGVSRDITDQKQAEETLRLSEEKYRLLFQNMSEGFALYELLYDDQGQPSDWRVLEVNDAYTRHTGLAREQIAGRRISEMFPDALPEYLPRFAEVVATQTPAEFETFAEAVGRYQHVVTFPAGGNRFANIIEDISDRKRAEEAVRASEEKFAAVFRVSPDGLLIARVGDGTILDVNEAFTRTLGYGRSELVGARIADVGMVPPGDATDRLLGLYGKQAQVVGQELDFRTKAGESATMLVSLARIKVAEEECVLAVTHDITRRKRSEEALHRAEAALALANQERARAEERQRLARELHDSVSQALYGISLGAHTALTRLDDDRGGVLEALRYVITLAQAGLDEMRALIFELRPESLEAEGLVAALTKQAVALRASHGVKIELSLCPEPDVPLPLKEALYRIGLEALRNAVKHARADRVDLRLACRPDGIALEVSDNGLGFDPLASYPGHLGLQSMRERARGLGGTLDILSAPQAGTQIRAWLPVGAG